MTPLLLADPSTNMLRADYQVDAYDAHPKELANRTIGPLFADFIDQAIRTYTAQREEVQTLEVFQDFQSLSSKNPTGLRRE